MVAPTPRLLVTGAASGIGRAIAQRFVDGGWDVCGLDRQPAPAELAACEWLTCDLDDAVARDRTIDRLTTQHWSALVNCAGVAGVGDPARVLRINFLAARAITAALSPTLDDNGSIIHISSGAGMKWNSRQDLLRPILDADDADALGLGILLAETPAKAYELSKELLCLYGLSSCLNQMHRGVRTNVVSPGGVETALIPDFTRSMGPDAMAFSLSVTKRHARVEEIAEVAWFLASPLASWINGADIRVDGGLTAALTTGVVDFPAWN